MNVEALLDVVTAHRVGLERLSTGVLKDLLEHLVVVEDDIELQIRKRLQNAAPGEVDATSKRLQGLLDRVRKAHKEATAAFTGDLQKALLEVGAHESGFVADAYGRALRINASMEQLGAEQLEAIVTSKPMQGRWLKDWFSSFERGTVDRIEQQILIGMTEGEGVDQIVRRLRGTKAEGYRDGIYSTNRRSAEMVVRTSMNHVSNQAHVLTLEKNKHLFPRYQWISVLDKKTSPICRHRASKVFELGKGPVPPAHPNCRSTIIAIPKGMPDDFFGDLSYENWLKKQPAEDVEDILGPTRARLWKRGELPLDGFVNREGEQIRLDRLREIEQKAWERAGLGEPYKPLPPLKATSVGAKAVSVSDGGFAAKPEFTAGLTAAGMSTDSVKKLVKAAKGSSEPDRVIAEGVGSFVNSLSKDEVFKAAGLNDVNGAFNNFSTSSLDWYADRARKRVAELEVDERVRKMMLDHIDEAMTRDARPARKSMDAYLPLTIKMHLQGDDRMNTLIGNAVANPFAQKLIDAAKRGEFGDLSSKEWDRIVGDGRRAFFNALDFQPAEYEDFLVRRSREVLTRRLSGSAPDPFAGGVSLKRITDEKAFYDKMKAELLGLESTYTSGEGFDGSSVIREVMKVQGAPLTIRRVSTDDFETAPGAVLWRGVGDNHTPSKYGADKSGWIGKGVYGDGDYFGAGKSGLNVAVGYSRNLVRAKLAPDAKVYVSKTPVSPEGVASVGMFKRVLENIAKDVYSEKVKKLSEGIPAIVRVVSESADRMKNDSGSKALAAGYDAIYVPDLDYYVILNRSKIVVEDALQ